MALERTLRMIVLDNGDRTTINFSNANPNVDAQILNTSMRQLNALTTNTYVDTHVIDTQSLNEIIAEADVDRGGGI